MSARTFPDFSGRTIDAGRLFLRKILGRGGTGVVYEATDIVDPARPTYAVKWLGLPKKSGMRREQQLEYLDRFDAEYLHHARVSDHPNVVTLHRIIDDAELRCKWLVLDYCPGGDLFDAITTRNPFWLNEERTRSICLQLIDAVAHCHARGIYHRDIKPENILISADCNTIYLSDFGLSTTDAWCTQTLGTRGYNAPERLDKDFRLERDMGAYSCALGDVWSVAITIFNMLTGHPPWKCAHPRCNDAACHGFIVHTLYPSANHHRYRFPISTDMHRLWRDAVALEPSARLNLREFRARFVHARELFPSEEQIREQIALKPHTEDRMARMIEQLFVCADEFAAYEVELDAAEAFEAAVLAASPDLLQTPRLRDTVLLLDTSAPDDVPDDCFTIGSDSDTSPVSISGSSAPTASDSDDPDTPASAIVPVVLDAAEVSILELSTRLATTDLVASAPDGNVESETLALSAKASGDCVAAAIYRPGFGPASVRRARVDLLLR